MLVRAHHLFERLDRLLAADEERHDHVREDDDVAQRQDRDRSAVAWLRRRTWLGVGHAIMSFLVPLADTLCASQQCVRTGR